jgi:hypothetical protein
MYSGSTLTTYSGRIMGAHQKIDRSARRHVAVLLPPTVPFPSIRTILHFEGGNGPDAIKRKSPAHDEPWHYFDPYDKKDIQLIGIIHDHYKNLVQALRKGNKERASFEAAWLAHAVVDGLTPAHHYPYEEKLVQLRGGEGLETRITIKDKLVLPGDTKRDQVKNNWKMWGPKGLFTNHYTFELGIASMIMPMRFHKAIPSLDDISLARKLGVPVWFRRTAQEIAALELYDTFMLDGWTPKIARAVKKQLAPTLVRAVSTIWCCAAQEAAGMKK